MSDNEIEQIYSFDSYSFGPEAICEWELFA